MTQSWDHNTSNLILTLEKSGLTTSSVVLRKKNQVGVPETPISDEQQQFSNGQSCPEMGETLLRESELLVMGKVPSESQ